MRDTLKQFLNLSAALQAERDAIRARLAELDRVLGTGSGVPSTPDAPKRRGRPPGARSLAPADGKIGMREAITMATRRGPLGIRDLVPAMEQLGFRFKSKNPANSVGAYLYGNAGRQYFRKQGQGFVAR